MNDWRNFRLMDVMNLFFSASCRRCLFFYFFDASTTTVGLCVTTVLIESREKNHLHEIRSKLNVESSDISSCRERNREEESALVG